LTEKGRMNVYQRLAEVRKTVSYLKKENRSNQYDYVGSSDVLGTLHQTINDNGLLLIPSIKGHNVTLTTKTVHNQKYGDKERTTYFTEVDTNMRWQNIDDPNDFLDCSWYSQGVDIEGEKGVGKALTYGEKYFMLKFFNIATDKDDPDSFQQKQETRRQQSQPPQLIDGKQLAQLKDEARKISELAENNPDDVLKELNKMLNISDVSQMMASNFTGAMNVLNKWHKGYAKKAGEKK